MINTKRAMKGSSWRDIRTNTASMYYQISSDPYFRFYNRGFRCVYSVNSEPQTSTCVLRGGSWYFSYTDLFRAHYRYRLDPGLRFYNPGFRCVYPTVNGGASG